MTEFFDFDEQNKIGLRGEALFTKYFGHMWEKVMPGVYWPYDFKRKFGNEDTLELKTDDRTSYSTGNFFIELYSNRDTQRLGGPFSVIDSATFFAYLFLRDRRLFVFNTKDIIEYLIKESYFSTIDGKFIAHTSKWLIPIHNKKHVTEGLIIPISVLQKMGPSRCKEFYLND